jgi:hypothetical protein
MPGHDQRVEVSANGNAVARWRFTTPDARDVSFHIPAAYVRRLLTGRGAWAT